jgi:invasion protein IalB
MSVRRLPAGQQAVAGATIVVPLQTLLTQQLTISIDGGQTKRYPFRFCTQLGCFAQIGLTEGEVNAFKRGAQATATIVPAAAPDARVSLNISLTGFTAGYDSIAP